MTDLSIVKIGLVLLIASLVAIASRRLHIPYSVGLVIAGAGLAVLPVNADLPFTPSLFTLLLPPLIFEAAIQIHWHSFRRELPVILTLAVAGVAVSAAVVATGMSLILGWDWLSAALFGALIAATDPVSVIAAFKEMDVAPRLSLLVEGESLLNDGTAAVGFAVLAAVAAGASPTPLSLAYLFAWTVLGAVAVGVAVAAAVLLIAGRTDDHLVEITLTTIIAYGSFLIAEHFHMSGILSSLTAGVVVGNWGWQKAISPSGRGHVLSFWEYAAFLANSVIFIVIGLHEAHQAKGLFTLAAAIAILLALLGRTLAVYPFCALFARSSLVVRLRDQHILVWGGLRGGLALALALSVPESVAKRADIIVIAFAVVAFSIFAQSLTMPLLMRRLGLVD